MHTTTTYIQTLVVHSTTIMLIPTSAYYQSSYIQSYMLIYNVHVIYLLMPPHITYFIVRGSYSEPGYVLHGQSPHSLVCTLFALTHSQLECAEHKLNVVEFIL